jgi:hypothetical protein
MHGTFSYKEFCGFIAIDLSSFTGRIGSCRAAHDNEVFVASDRLLTTSMLETSSCRE